MTEYREQIISIFWELDRTVANLFHMGFNIGLQEEWQDLKEAILGPDPIPIAMDLEYLRAINHVAVPGIIEMIEILAEARNSLANINLLTEEELSSPPELLDDLEEADDEVNESHYLDAWLQGLYMDFLTLFEIIWELEHNTDLPKEKYSEFNEGYYDGALVIESKDQNVSLLLDALNRTMDVNRRTEFYV